MTDYLSEEEPALFLASKTNRFFAILIDYTICFICWYYIAKYWGEEYITEDGGVGYHVEGLPALSWLLVWFSIMPLMEGLTGQSIGKIIFKIKISKADGTKVSIGNATVRHLFDFVDYLPFFGIVGIIVASKNGLSQRVGDLVAKTIVIRK